MDKSPVLIIGGGISGLSVAWWLARSGIPCQVWEGNETPGGKVVSNHQDGYITEQAASMLVNFRDDVNEFIDASGLNKLKVLRSETAAGNRYLLDQQQLRAVPSDIRSMLSSSLWSLPGKLRLATELFKPARSCPDESVSDFVRRRFGNELLDKAMEPFVSGTLASDPDQANAYSVLPRLTTLERQFGSITGGVLAKKLFHRHRMPLQQSFSFSGGMSSLVAALSQTPGVDLRCGYRVKSITRSGNGWQVWADTPEGEQLQQVSQLVVSTPAPQAANLLSGSNTRIAELLRHIHYAPLNLVHLGIDREQIKHPLDGSGFLTPRSADLKLNGNLWLSRLFPGRAPAGKVLFTSYLGGARNPQYCVWDDQQSSNAVVDDLSRVFNSNISPSMVRIDRHAQALPLYHGQYYQLCQSINQQRIQQPGLHLAANYIGGVSVRDRITEGRRISADIVEQLQQASTTTTSTTTKTAARPILAV